MMQTKSEVLAEPKREVSATEETKDGHSTLARTVKVRVKTAS